MAVKKASSKAKTAGAKKAPAPAKKKAPAKAVKKAPAKKKAAEKKTAAKTVKASPAKPAVKPQQPQTASSTPVIPPRDQCRVDELGGNSFVIVVEKARNFFDLAEMRTLVNMCHAASDEKDAASRLYRWLAEHRKDVLIDSRIANALDIALASIYRYLVSHYSIRQS